VGGRSQDHVTNDHFLYRNGTRVHLKRYAPARTVGEVWGDIKGFRRPQAGEALWNGPFPFTNDSSGQAIEGCLPGAVGVSWSSVNRIEGLQF
jgi:hypothetical protein